MSCFGVPVIDTVHHPRIGQGHRGNDVILNDRSDLRYRMRHRRERACGRGGKSVVSSRHLSYLLPLTFGPVFGRCPRIPSPGQLINGVSHGFRRSDQRVGNLRGSSGHVSQAVDLPTQHLARCDHRQLPSTAGVDIGYARDAHGRFRIRVDIRLRRQGQKACTLVVPRFDDPLGTRTRHIRLTESTPNAAPRQLG